MLKNNRDFLLIDDARLCNPNGNPDDENRPRMDDDTQTLLVSDVRVKRTVRDFSQKKDSRFLSQRAMIRRLQWRIV